MIGRLPSVAFDPQLLSKSAIMPPRRSASTASTKNKSTAVWVVHLSFKTFSHAKTQTSQRSSLCQGQSQKVQWVYRWWGWRDVCVSALCVNSLLMFYFTCSIEISSDDDAKSVKSSKVWVHLYWSTTRQWLLISELKVMTRKMSLYL
jgi:hypothetical protein